MVKPALLGVGLAAVIATTATAQVYYPYSYPGYTYYPGYSYYSYPAYTYRYGYPAYGYSYSYAPNYGWAWPYPVPTYQTAPAYSDAYVSWRPYSDSAGPRASGHVGY